MTLLLALGVGLVALLLHLALTLAAAPLVDRLITAAAAVAGGASPQGGGMSRPGASLAATLMRPWQDLAGLAARQPVRARSASAVTSLAPQAALAATLVAAALVPSFATGMLTGPVADLMLILAMLGLARAALLLCGFDAGLSGIGLAAVSLAVRSLLAVPGCVLALYALSLDSGTTGLDALLADPHGGSALPGLSPAVVLAATALGLAALSAGGDEDALSAELSGPDLAAFRLQASLQRLVWINLVTALLLPSSLAVAQSNPLHWLLGLLLWVLRVGVACALLSGMQTILGVLAPASRRGLAGLSVLFGLLAPLLLLVGRGVE